MLRVCSALPRLSWAAVWPPARCTQSQNIKKRPKNRSLTLDEQLHWSRTKGKRENWQHLSTIAFICLVLLSESSVSLHQVVVFKLSEYTPGHRLISGSPLFFFFPQLVCLSLAPGRGLGEQANGETMASAKTEPQLRCRICLQHGSSPEPLTHTLKCDSFKGEMKIKRAKERMIQLNVQMEKSFQGEMSNTCRKKKKQWEKWLFSHCCGFLVSGPWFGVNGLLPYGARYNLRKSFLLIIPVARSMSMLILFLKHT